jgi:uncharacterized membrane protein (DUF2068 family)
MTDTSQITGQKPKRAPTLYLISGLKIAKGTLLLAVALGIYSLAHKDLPEMFDEFLRWIHLDPENKFFSAIGDRLENITPANVKAVASGTFLYGTFLLVGGLGLAFRARWAVWLAIGESAFFVPVEVYELVRHPNRWEVAIVLAFNILVVWYLFVNRERLFRHPHQPEQALLSPPG